MELVHIIESVLSIYYQTFAQKNWEILKKGLVGETYIIQTNMKERSKRILFVGENNDKM